MKKLFLFCALFLFVTRYTFSQAGKPDSSFGNRGIALTNMGKNKDNISLGRKVLVQADGSMYIVYITLSYYYYTEEDYEYAVTFITKKHSDGTTDSSYGTNGTTNTIYTHATDAALQTDGKIIIVGKPYYGYYDLNVVRFNANGTLDSSFSGDGKLNVAFATSVALQKDGKILFAGGVNISRYNIDGSADSSFGHNGVQTFDFAANDIAVQNDGKIVAAGYYYYWYQDNFIVARIDTNGNLDSSFSDDGIYKSTDSTSGSQASSVAIQSNGKIVIAAGSSLDISVWRFTAGGKPDRSFSTDGKQTTKFADYHYSFKNLVAIQSDGKIVAAGYSTVLRYNTDGSRDKSFSDDGMLTVKFRNDGDRVSSLAIQGNKIIVGGSSYTYTQYVGVTNTYYAVARFNTNGTADNTFAEKGVLVSQLGLGDTEFKSVAVQKDGKIVAAGVTFNGHDEDFAVVRYNVDGTLDSTFSGDGKQTTDFNGSSNAANAVAIQSDGKIVVAGYSGVDSSSYFGHFAIVRYNTDGTPDNTFSNDGKQITIFNTNDAVRSIAIQKDGKIVVAGFTSKLDSSNASFAEDFAVARYNTDGSLDKTFSGDGKQTTDYGLRDDDANAVAIQKDGKIVIGGSSGYGILINFALVRYNSDGSIDRTFSKNGIRTTSFDNKGSFISSIALQDDGKIIAAGQVSHFYTVNSILAVARYNTDGSSDSSFSGDGLQTTIAGSNAGFYQPFSAPVAIQNDGKIIAAVNYTYIDSLGEHFAFIRYNSNGSLDSTFSEDGIQTNKGYVVYGMAVSNNKLYAVGNSSAGVLNSNFGTTGKYNLIDKSKNNAPVVSITTPADNQIIAGPAASVSIKAAAVDIDGTISKVEFYNGTTLLHTDTAAPYTYTWTNVPFGKYTLTAKATDNLGATTTSAVVNISVDTNKAPTVSITDLVNDQTIGGPLSIRLKAAASDIDGTITKVEFYNGTTLLHTETEAPYSYSWANVSPGNYAITAKATDNSGAVTVSAVVNISVVSNSAPTVSITSPANGGSLTVPANITVSAAATDSDGTISSVKFYADTVLIGIQYISPYTFTWKNVPAGTYKITAKAIDNLGSSTVSAPVTITVSKIPNKPPVVRITEPVNNKSFAAPAYIHLEAAAYDFDGRITKVEFYNESTLLRTEYKYPYTYVWKDVPRGTYTITAVATDNYGAKTTSAPITVRVVSPPIASNRPSTDKEKTALNDALTLRLSPNPASNIVNVQTTGLRQNKPAKLSIISTAGIVLKTMQISNTVTQVDVSLLAGGVYTVKIVSGDKVMYKQFVKL